MALEGASTLILVSGHRTGRRLEEHATEIAVGVNRVLSVSLVGAATGRPYRFETETLEEAFARRWRLGISGEQIETWISWFQAIEKGEVSVVTDVVARLTGSPATPITDAAWWPAPKTARGLR